VIASIDTNQNGVISTEEQWRYSQEVSSGLRLREDDRILQIQLVTATSPAMDQMKAGTGEIELSFKAG
jgi:head-tail adaptor